MRISVILFFGTLVGAMGGVAYAADNAPTNPPNDPVGDQITIVGDKVVSEAVPTTLPSSAPNSRRPHMGPFGEERGSRDGRPGREMRPFFPLEHNRPMEKAAYLGVSASPVPAALREQLKLQKGLGMVVDFVEPASPAEAAGIQKFDILQKLNDQLLVDAYQLAVLVRTCKAGDDIQLTVIHQGQTQTLTAKLVEKEVPPLDETNPWVIPPMPWNDHMNPGEPMFRPTTRPSDRR